MNKDEFVNLCAAMSGSRTNRGYSEEVRRALELGASPSSQNLYSVTALHVAEARGLIDIVEILLQHGANTNLKDKKGRTPLNCSLERKEHYEKTGRKWKPRRARILELLRVAEDKQKKA